MFGSLVLLSLVPAAPIPKAPPPAITVTAKRTVRPPIVLITNGGQQVLPIDDGHYVEVTVKNTSKDTVRVSYYHSPGDLLYAKVTDAKGVEVSERGYHHTLRSPSGIEQQPEVRELRPGDSFTELVHLPQDWPDAKEKRKPGKYAARIVFESGKLRAESAATFEMEITK